MKVSKLTILRSNHCVWIKTRAVIKDFFFFLCSIRMPNLSLNELKQIAKMRHIKGYKSMSKERLLRALDESESAVQIILE